MAVPWTEIKSSKPVFQYRSDIAKSLGVEPGDLTTIEGIDAFLTEIASKNPGMTPYDMAMKGDAGDIITLLMPKYGLITLGVNNLVYDINDPDVKIKALKTKQDVLRPNIIESPIVGFVPSTEMIKTELALHTQLSTEQGKLLLSGVVKNSVDGDIADYVKKQQEAGTEKIIANIQAQIDAFLASK
ncbi:DUF3502 domain-containing protein [Paenibacillus sp. CAU 1782]